MVEIRNCLLFGQHVSDDDCPFYTLLNLAGIDAYIVHSPVTAVLVLIVTFLVVELSHIIEPGF